MTEARLRWIKFWPEDWQRDPALRCCTLAARGLWMELLCIAHEGTPYGHVTINGRAPSTRQVAAIVGVPEREAVKLIDELATAGVFNRTGDDVIFSRRLVRDMAARERGRETGSTGGNPQLARRDNPSSEMGLTPLLIPQEARGERLEADKEESLAPLAACPMLIEDSAPQKSLKPRPAPGAPGADFIRFWTQYPKRQDRGHAWKAWRAAVRKATPDVIIAGLERCRFPTDPQFIPLASTWLNGERWADQTVVPIGRRPDPSRVTDSDYDGSGFTPMSGTL